MELLFVNRNTSEWDFMWLWLELHPINEGLSDPITALNNGEAWQYMGSFRNKGEVIHEFRHRNHPKTKTLYTASLKASDTFNDDQIEKSVKIS